MRNAIDAVLLVVLVLVGAWGWFESSSAEKCAKQTVTLAAQIRQQATQEKINTVERKAAATAAGKLVKRADKVLAEPIAATGDDCADARAVLDKYLRGEM